MPVTKERFAEALSELIGMCMDGGLHLMDMVPALEKELAWAKEQIERVDREGGAPPKT